MESRNSIQAGLATAVKRPVEAEVLEGTMELGPAFSPAGLWNDERGRMQMLRDVFGEAWPFLVGLLFLGWGLLGFVSQ